MKILFVLNHFMPQQMAGTEVYTWALAKEMVKRNEREEEVVEEEKAKVEEDEVKVEVEGREERVEGKEDKVKVEDKVEGREVEEKRDKVEVLILIPNYGKGEDEEYIYDGLRVIKYAEPSVDDRDLIMGFKEPEGLKNFKAQLAAYQPTVVHFHELAPGSGISLPHLRTAKDSGARVITTLHLVEYSCMTSKLLYKENHLCDGKIKIWKCSSCYLHAKGYKTISPFLLPVSYGLFRMGIDTTTQGTKTGTALGTAQLTARKKKYLEAIARHSDKIVVLTEWYQKMLADNGIAAHKLAFIPQALPTTGSTMPYRTKAATALPLKIVFLGRIDPLKGLHLLTETLLQLPTASFSLDIYGQPVQSSYEKELKDKTAAHKNISWKGRLEQGSVVDVLKNYDLLCLPSTIAEMSPLVIQEAYAAGLPVLASNVHGNAEQILHNHNGLLFEFNNTASLKAQLERCLAEPGLLPSLRSRLPQPRSFDQTGAAYYQLYQSIAR